MEKILKNYTTIPEHLYVNRSADRQLKSIIDEMQRPGYVLVARQMGKTNLLFNAKRTLENENRLFAYVDLSNLFDNERDCYRNIIENIIEPNINLFDSITEKIETIKAANLPPHNEYSRCLRVILNKFEGNLVIVLDEIDALKSVDYSDGIFAQIRSNYFSRTNFLEFERLTYVLSGVIEPTELIKDRNKSPFNIGDKIYLDDFTKEEHNDFIQKSKLNISQELSDEIYDLANGNPRLTFDICSELENHILTGDKVGKDLLDNIVKKKYLTTYDVAPIDHIRELVKTNKKIRKSVSLINRKQTFELSDEIKQKLYLYGIIDSKFDEDIKIKNKIIENCLTEEWIRSVEKLSTDVFTYGLDKIESGEYLEGISILLDFLSNYSPTKFQIEACNYHLGYAYYQLGDYDTAVNYFSNEFSQPIFKSNAPAFIGNCKIATGKEVEGIKILEKVIETEIDNFAYRNALLNLARNLPKGEEDRALHLLQLLYKSTFESKDDTSEVELKKSRTLALYYQAESLIRKINDDNDSESINEVLSKIDEALAISDLSDSLFLIYFKYLLQTEKDESLKVLLLDRIINNRLLFDRQHPHAISFNERSVYSFLDFLFDESKPELFERLLDYTTTQLIPSSDKYDVIYRSALISVNNKRPLLNYLTRFKNDLTDDLAINLFRNVAYHSYPNRKEFFSAFEKYLSFFLKTSKIIAEDIFVFAIAIRLNFDSIKFKSGIDLCNLIEPKLNSIDDEKLRLESVIIYYWFAVLYDKIKDRLSAKQYADKALELVSSANIKSLSTLDEKGLMSLSQQLHQIKNPPDIDNIFVKNKKYGKNELVKVRYFDGREVEGKYKRFEGDIGRGRCVILEQQPLKLDITKLITKSPKQ